jgi:EAL domain-containing protein (putative c-di-GMP-specific phosphodiesterase class I)
MLRHEITESEMMQNLDIINVHLKKMKDLKILLHMDDFGKGYSSLSQLVNLKIDTLKIDGSFVSNMTERGENFEIVKMIVNLAHNLGMDVIAEGVETEEQLARLRRLGCEYAQGYYFSRPVPGEEAERFLAKGLR